MKKRRDRRHPATTVPEKLARTAARTQAASQAPSRRTRAPRAALQAVGDELPPAAVHSAAAPARDGALLLTTGHDATPPAAQAARNGAIPSTVVPNSATALTQQASDGRKRAPSAAQPVFNSALLAAAVPNSLPAPTQRAPARRKHAAPPAQPVLNSAPLPAAVPNSAPALTQQASARISAPLLQLNQLSTGRFFPRRCPVVRPP